ALETLWAVFLSRYSGMEDLVVGIPVAGRSRPEVEGTIGFFVNALPLRHTLSGNPTFLDLLERTRKTALAAYAHQDLPFEKLVEELAPHRDTSHAPIFQTMFALDDTASLSLNLPGLKTKPLEADFAFAKFDLLLNLSESGDGLAGNLEYSTDLFMEETAARMARHFCHLAKTIVKTPLRPVREAALLDETEYRQMVAGFEMPDVVWPQEETLAGRFAAQVARTPDAIALVAGATHLTYAQLDARANRIAQLVREILPKDSSDLLVGIYLERGSEQVAAILGVLKAGCAYLPLDLHAPSERLAFILEDAHPQAVLTTRVLAQNLRALSHAGTESPFIFLDEQPGLNACAPKVTIRPENLAYVIYTSGSTGRPKGVMVEQRNVVQLLLNNHLPYDFGPGDVWTLFHSCAFDFSVWELFGALLFGGRLVVVDDGTVKDPETFLGLLHREQVTVLNQIPSYFTQLSAVAMRRALPLAVRYLIFGAEALYPGVVRDWAARYPQTRIVNMYGITETTVHVTWKTIEAEDMSAGISNIGRPLAPLKLFILDANAQPQPLKVPGEIYVGGAGVSRGYLNRPELTAERFLPNPFGEGRLYRTGDWARRLENGEIEYLGRIDQQVKIRGFRIELGEIEAVIRDFPGVRDVLVNPFGERGHQRLCAYIVGDCDFAQLRSFLAEKLPDYMIPAAFMNLPALPLTASGKADRKSLPHPETVSHREYRPPRTQSEETLCALCAKI
ncbi:MAG: amino acid adenylation domain-containing protein, partial [bacterium]|nr:amino acid adenylation domain-containing protein [bacterium]